MKTIEFPCYTNFGSGNSTDWEIEVELTDEEYALLESVIAKEPEEEFYQNQTLVNVFKKVYKEAVEQATADALFYDDELRAKYGNDPSWKASDIYSINVEYPEL